MSEQTRRLIRGAMDEVDQGVIPLLNVLNDIRGIATRESCCGHGTRPLRVNFWATDNAIEQLTALRLPDGWWIKRKALEDWEEVGIRLSKCEHYILRGPIGSNGLQEMIAVIDKGRAEGSINAFREGDDDEKGP